MSLLSTILSGLQLVSGLAGVFVDPANKKHRWIFITILLFIFAATMASDYQDFVNQKDAAARRQTEIEKRQREKENSERKIDSLLTLEQQMLTMISQTIQQYGTTKAVVTDTEVQRTVFADARLRTLRRTAAPVRPEIRVEYFIKDVDRTIISQELRKLGFHAELKNPVNPFPTNAIWVGNNVTLDETRQLAYALIRAGVELRAIRRFQNGGGAQANLIQVGADPAIRSYPVLTVAQVAALAHL
jgi:hypothetical protein